MKKTLKFLSIILISMLMIFAFSQSVCYADDKSLDDFVSGLKTSSTNVNVNSEVTTIGNTIINWIWGISIVVAIVALMVIGIQFIVNGTQAKAEYKKSLMTVLVGTLLIVFATTVVKILFSING